MSTAFVEVARAALTAEEPVALAIVVHVTGSAPQRVSAKLVARAGGAFVGTAGGGALEAGVLRDCEAALSAPPAAPPAVRTYRLGAELGMCCGGTMDVFVERVNEETRAVLARACAELEAERPVVLGLVIASETGETAVGAQFLYGGGGFLAGAGPSETLREAVGRDCEALLGGGVARQRSFIGPEGSAIEVYLEPICPQERLILFGGGHVAAPVSHVGKRLGFRVVVVDEREDWANRERFPDADQIVNSAFEDFLAAFRHRASDYLLIVTKGHEQDQEVLEAVIDEEYRYLGMIGSRAKAKRALLRLEAAGFLPELLGRVRVPVGLNVGAQTPDEIAVAIGAELVAVRRGCHLDQTGAPRWWREADD